MRNMQKMWEDYAKEVQVLRERIAELREVLQRDKTMAPLERQELEARKRLLSEEVRDMERSMADIAVYAENEKAGESACASQKPPGNRCCFPWIFIWTGRKNNVPPVWLPETFWNMTFLQDRNKSFCCTMERERKWRILHSCWG